VTTEQLNATAPDVEITPPVTAASAEPPAPGRRARRSRPRAQTTPRKRLTREALREGALLSPPIDIPRPTSRADCVDAPRPCPWVACKHHLYLDVNPETGSIKINVPELEPWELKHTCALDVAGRQGITLEEVGEIMNLSRERVRQVLIEGLHKLRTRSRSLGDEPRPAPPSAQEPKQ
jgi:hypothetical protein